MSLSGIRDALASRRQECPVERTLDEGLDHPLPEGTDFGRRESADDAEPDACLMPCAARSANAS